MTNAQYLELKGLIVAVRNKVDTVSLECELFKELLAPSEEVLKSFIQRKLDKREKALEDAPTDEDRKNIIIGCRESILKNIKA